MSRAVLLLSMLLLSGCADRGTVKLNVVMRRTCLIPAGDKPLYAAIPIELSDGDSVRYGYGPRQTLTCHDGTLRSGPVGR